MPTTVSLSFDPATFSQRDRQRFTFSTPCISHCPNTLIWDYDSGEPQTRDHPGSPGYYYVRDIGNGTGCDNWIHIDIYESGKPYDEIEELLIRADAMATTLDDVYWRLKYRSAAAMRGTWSETDDGWAWTPGNDDNDDGLDTLPF